MKPITIMSFISNNDFDRLEASNRIHTRRRSIRNNQDIIDDDDVRITETERAHCRATIEVLKSEITQIAKDWDLI